MLIKESDFHNFIATSYDELRSGPNARQTKDQYLWARAAKLGATKSSSMKN